MQACHSSDRRQGDSSTQMVLQCWKSVWMGHAAVERTTIAMTACYFVSWCVDWDILAQMSDVSCRSGQPVCRWCAAPLVTSAAPHQRKAPRSSLDYNLELSTCNIDPAPHTMWPTNMTKQNHFHNILSGSLFPTEVAKSSSFDGVKAGTFLCGIPYGMRVLVAVKLVANCHTPFGWLSSRVVSVSDSSAEGPRFKSKSQCSRVTVLGKLFTPIVPLFTKQPNW